MNLYVTRSSPWRARDTLSLGYQHGLVATASGRVVGKAEGSSALEEAQNKATPLPLFRGSCQSALREELASTRPCYEVK